MEIKKTEDEFDVFSDDIATEIKLVTKNTKPLMETYLCPIWNSPINIDNVTVKCNTSDNVSARSKCKTK